MERVITYIDGFNLYFGMKDSGFRRFYWLDVTKLAASFLQANQTLAATKYFTARIDGTQPDKRKRQGTYLEAIDTLPGLTIYYGHYLAKPVKCFTCGATWQKQEEKMTDVCLATELLMDAHAGRFDTAIVVSGDSDLVPPVNAIHATFPKLRVVVACPPNRKSVNLSNSAKGSFQIGRGKLAAAQLPPTITKQGGFVLTRPAEWA